MHGWYDRYRCLTLVNNGLPISSPATIEKHGRCFPIFRRYEKDIFNMLKIPTISINVIDVINVIVVAFKLYEIQHINIITSRDSEKFSAKLAQEEETEETSNLVSDANVFQYIQCVRKILSYREREAHCRSMQPCLVQFAWTCPSRSERSFEPVAASSFRRGNEEDTRCRSSGPVGSRSDEIHGINSPSHSLSFFLFFLLFLPLPSFLSSCSLIASSLLLARCCLSLPFKSCRQVCVYVQWAYRDKSKGSSAADSRTRSGQVYQA